MRPHLPEELWYDEAVKDAWDNLSGLIAAEGQALNRWAIYGGALGFEDARSESAWNKAAACRRKLKKAAQAFETAVLDAMVRCHNQPDYTRYYAERWMIKLERRGDVSTVRDERNMSVWEWSAP